MSNEGAGQVFIVAAPSGAGKTSLVRALISEMPGIVMSISHTTRDPRPGENNGEHYHFIDLDTYQAMVDQGEFLEHAQVHGNGYGSSRGEVRRAAERGLDLVLEIDWQGAQQAKKLIPDARSIFILPPSRAELAKRLRSRAQDSDEVIARRLAGAVAEMRHWDEFDFLVVNDEFDKALEQLKTIIRACRLSRPAQTPRLAPLLKDLLGG
ncbi:MAG: guanylate kinase [Pseudomonadota bacterium]